MKVGSVIDKKRLVLGVFREAEVYGTDVCCALKNGKTVHSKVSLGTNDCLVLEVGTSVSKGESILLYLQVPEGVCEGESLVLSVNGHEAIVSLPQSISVSEQRDRPRTQLGEGQVSDYHVDIAGAGVHIFGSLSDISDDFLRVTSSLSVHDLEPGCEVQVSGVSQGKASLSLHGTVHFVRCFNGRSDIVIRRTDILEKNKIISRGNRQNLSSAATVKLQWVGIGNLVSHLVFKNVSLRGFCGQLIDDEKLTILVGSRAYLAEMGLSATLIWKSINAYGFDLQFNTQEALNTWADAVSNRVIQRSQSSSRPITRDLIRLMVRSGYLTGLKASIYKSPDARIAAMNLSTSELWLRRTFFLGPVTQAASHVSVLRISDIGWMVQELGSVAPNEDAGTLTLDTALWRLLEQELPGVMQSSSLYALYEPKSEFNKRYWVRSHSGTTESQVSVFPWKDIELLSSKMRSGLGRFESLKIRLPTIDTWASDYKQMEMNHNKVLLGAMGLFEETYLSPQLADQIHASGLMFQRRVAMVENNGKIIAVLARFGLPSLSNLTLSADHLWVSSSSGTSLKDLLDLIKASNEILDLNKGALQVVMNFQDTGFLSTVDLPGLKKLRLLRIPLKHLKEFLENAK